MEYTKVKSKKSNEEYLYIAPERELTDGSCRQLLLEINGKCLESGYERIMLDLSNLEHLLSVNNVYQAINKPEMIKFLPFRIAWVADNSEWEKNWKSLELIMQNRSLPWHRFSNTDLAEQWLSLDRREIGKGELKSSG